MIKRAYLCLFFAMFFSFLWAQKRFQLSICATDLGEESLYINAKGDTINLDVLKFYISNIELLAGDTVLWKEQNSFHLFNIEEKKALTLNFANLPTIPITAIRFHLGIDSLTNVSGAIGGDLDPLKGMYWAWQSGYINVKLEGRSKLCNTRNHEFQFHLGGYLPPYYALQSISLNIPLAHQSAQNQQEIVLLDITNLLNEIDLSQQNAIMSPCKEAVLLSQKVAKHFRMID